MMPGLETVSGLETVYCGVKLRSPVIVGSANITATMENIKACQDSGAGAVVMKSLFEKEVCRIAPTPRFALIHRKVANEKSFTLYSYEQASSWGLARYAREIERCKAELDIPIIASINCYTQEGWLNYARRIEAAGADILELNVSCPHSSVTFAGVEVESTILDVVRAVREAVKIPIVTKLTPQLTSPLNMVYELERLGSNGVVLFNRFTGLEIDIEAEKPIMHGAYAGHGGPWSIHLPLRWISAIRGHVKLDISGSGGVAGPEDVIKYLLAGANTVQVCTAVIMNGYKIVERLNRGLIDFMERKGYKTIDDFRGKVNAKILATEDVFREHVSRAVIDPEKCKGCGRCFDVCSHFAVEPEGDVYIIKHNCDGCGLCPQVCPTDAISLVGIRGSGKVD